MHLVKLSGIVSNRLSEAERSSRAGRRPNSEGKYSNWFESRYNRRSEDNKQMESGRVRNWFRLRIRVSSLDHKSATKELKFLVTIIYNFRK